MSFTLKDVPLPARFRFARPMNSEALMRLSADNRDLCMEKESDGAILVLLPKSPYCGSIELKIHCQLQLWARANGSGKVFGAGVGFSLPDGSVRAASAVWISPHRWNGLNVIASDDYPPLCPNFVVEVRSRLDDLSRLASKMDAWVANGAELGWLLDTELNTVSVYSPHEKTKTLNGFVSVKGTGPISGFELVII